MVDVLTQKQRSYNMSRIRNKWTKQEKIIHNYLKGRRIKHKMHPEITGKPDILLENPKILVFLDGCFWHRCPKCFKEPSTNKEFWLSKIEGNVRKDGETTKILTKKGWKVVRIWEHEIKENPRECVIKITG